MPFGKEANQVLSTTPNCKRDRGVKIPELALGKQTNLVHTEPSSCGVRASLAVSAAPALQGWGPRAESSAISAPRPPGTQQTKFMHI